jgi:hypothetical protein
MGNRHQSIGVKQVIPYEWVRKTARLMLAGMDAREIRQELHAALNAAGKQVQSGERSAWTRTFLVNNLMAIWPSPDPELAPFRDVALRALQKYPDQELPIQWAVISAAYPFWFNIARQVGRLLNLQAQATQAQIVGRLKEQYGDRQTVSRYARFVVRSFVDWGVLEDADTTGCYRKKEPISLAHGEVTAILLHAALLATPEGKAPLSSLMSNPALFPFHLVDATSATIVQASEFIKVLRYGLDDEFLTLRP